MQLSEKLEEDARMCQNASDEEIAESICAGLATMKDGLTMAVFLTAVVGIIRRSEQIRLRECS